MDRPESYIAESLSRIEQTVLEWEARWKGKASGREIFSVFASVSRECFSHPKGSPYIDFGWDPRARGEELATRLAAIVQLGKLDMRALEEEILRTFDYAERNLDDSTKVVQTGDRAGMLYLEADEFNHDVMYPVDEIARVRMMHRKLGLPIPASVEERWTALEARLRSELPPIVEFLAANDEPSPRIHDYFPEEFWWERMFPNLVLDRHYRRAHASSTAPDQARSHAGLVQEVERLVAPVKSLLAVPPQGPGFWTSVGMEEAQAKHGIYGEGSVSEKGRLMLRAGLDDLYRRMGTLDAAWHGEVEAYWRAELHATVAIAEQQLAAAKASKRILVEHFLSNASLQEVIWTRDRIGTQELVGVACGFVKPAERDLLVARLDESMRPFVLEMARSQPAAVGGLAIGRYPPDYWWRDTQALLR